VAPHILLLLVPAAHKLQTVTILFFQLLRQLAVVEVANILALVPALADLVEVETDQILEIIQAAQEIHHLLRQHKEIMAVMDIITQIILVAVAVAPHKLAKMPQVVAVVMAEPGHYGRTPAQPMLVEEAEAGAVQVAVVVD
jgi:hypothetical protein